MKSAQQLVDEGFNWHYQPILNSFGEILVQVDDVDYSGDSRLLYKLEDGFGILIFGWGSCSGCDGLYRNEGNIEGTQEFIDLLYSQMIRLEDENNVLNYVNDKEARESEYGYRSDETQTFYKKILEYIGKGE